jgi:hypothetical protein
MSGKCHQCPKNTPPKKVTMHVEDGPDGKKIITYLCGPCRRELGLDKADAMGSVWAH